MTNCSTGNTRRLGCNDSENPTFISGLLGFALLNWFLGSAWEPNREALPRFVIRGRASQ